jgi:hypothetical protein
MAKKIAEYFEVFKVQGDSIVKNTALPDFVKQRESERFKELSRTKFYDKIQTGLFGSGSGIERGIAKIKGLMKENIADFVSGMSDARDAMGDIYDAQDMLGSMDMGDGKKTSAMDMAMDMGVDMGAGMVGKAGVNSLGRKVAEKIRNKMTGNNPLLTDFAKKSMKYGTDIPASLRELARSDALKVSSEELNEGGIMNAMRRNGKYGLKNIISLFTDTTDTTIDQGEGFTDLTKPAIFDVVTKRSIDNIIPGYLARILREVQVFRTGDETISLTEFDHGSNQFMDRKKIVRSIKKLMQRTIAGDDVKRRFTELEQQIGLESFSPEAQKALRTIMSNTISDRNAGIIDSKTFMDEKHYRDLDPNVAEEIQS